MDAITAAIVAALPTLASEIVKGPISDAYQALKAVIRRKWGADSGIATSIDVLETRPTSKGRATVLAENVAEVSATSDADVMHALSKLIEALANAGINGSGAAEITTMIGGGVVGIAGVQHVAIGTQNIGAPPTDGTVVRRRDDRNTSK